MARRPQSKPPVLPGYSYLRPLGSGGFADVFLYEQDMPRRAVAVKVLTTDAINAEARSQFVAEANVMAQLSAHPSILTIFEASISADGRPYLATEFCPESLGDRYKQAPLPVALVLDAGVRMAGALATAHRSGVLHRDIKPSNMLVTTLGQPVLSDFGIAASLNPYADDGQLVAMSVPWSSPEVVSETSTGSVAAEVWSLGATLYTLLAGRTPFAEPVREKNTRDLMKGRVLRAKYSPIGRPDVAPEIEHLLARTMSKDPAGRPPSMQDLGEELRSLQAHLGLTATTLEVIGHRWAQTSAQSFAQPQDDPQAASPFSEAAAQQRGPVLTTVQGDSRRAARAERDLRARATIGVEGLESAPSRSGVVRRALIGGGVVAAVIVVIVVGLTLSGMLR